MQAQLSADRPAAHPDISVIIPTYNRNDSLLETLDSLASQVLAASRFQVVVIDDGSTDDTPQVASLSYPFELQYLAQQNQGAAAARNRGAHISRGTLLVFIDDDISLSPDFLQAILEAHHPRKKLASMGVFLPYLRGQDSEFARLYPRVIPTQQVSRVDQFVSFAECTSNNLAIDRQAFFDIGMWQDVLGDGPTLWGDVEFGYRAWKRGFMFLRVANAQLYHRDHSVVNLQSACERAHHISRAAHLLFQRYPEIMLYLPMFSDKTPISWTTDSPVCILRKILRAAASYSLALETMERLAKILEARGLESLLLVLLYRWIISAHIYKGYRLGLRELKEAAT